MTINSLQLNTSTPFAGLGTQTFNVLTAGLMTVSFKVWIPWQTSDQPSSVAPVPEVQTVTTVADVAGSLNSTFWTWYPTGNAAPNVGGGYYIWYNINSAGVDPAPAGLTGIQVAGATGASANTLAAATRTAIAAAVPSTVVTVSGATNAIILTSVQGGAATAAANGTASPGFGFSVGTTGTFGSASGLIARVNRTTTGPTTSNILVTLPPSPTQPFVAGAVNVQPIAGDVLAVVLTSLATADTGLNAIKGIINVFQGPGA